MAGTIFENVFGGLFRTPPNRRAQGNSRRSRIDELTSSYLSEINRTVLPPDDIRRELQSIFKHIRDECEAYGRGKRYIRMNILRILTALEQGCNAKKGEYLLGKWKAWEDMLNPASVTYIGINLPGTMILDNYIVFEDLVPIREYFEKHYSDGTFKRTAART